MVWPPKVGEPLPRAVEAVGVQRKLVSYSLDMAHEDGGPKARGFELILGITIDDVDYLEAAIRIGILSAPVSEVRDNPPHGVNCVVDVPIQGLGGRSGRIINVKTVWELTSGGRRRGL